MILHVVINTWCTTKKKKDYEEYKQLRKMFRIYYKFCVACDILFVQIAAPKKRQTLPMVQTKVASTGVVVSSMSLP